MNDQSSDDRSSDPDQTRLRLRNFHEGWKHAVAGRDYTSETLARLTWQNLGWRLGAILGETSPELVKETYDLCVRQQAEAGITRTYD